MVVAFFTCYKKEEVESQTIQQQRFLEAIEIPTYPIRLKQTKTTVFFLSQKCVPWRIYCPYMYCRWWYVSPRRSKNKTPVLELCKHRNNEETLLPVEIRVSRLTSNEVVWGLSGCQEVFLWLTDGIDTASERRRRCSCGGGTSRNPHRAGGSIPERRQYKAVERFQHTP